MLRHSRSPLVSILIPALVILLAFTSACHDGNSPTDPTGVQTTTLAKGHSASVAGGVVLSFDRVVSDSRCPTGVACAWEGEVTVRLILTDGGGSTPFTLSDHARSREVNGYTFTLIAVRPHPTAGSTIPESAYEVTVEVQRARS
jgi:hypothetical protein